MSNPTLSTISQRLYETQHGVYNALSSVIGDFDWPFTAIYNEGTEHRRVFGKDGQEVSVTLYRYHTGRYELTVYYTGVKKK